MNHSLVYYKNKIGERKNLYINLQMWEEASYCRDAERSLHKVIIGEDSIKSFLSYIKAQKYTNYDAIYEIIKPLDIISQRKSKLEKLHKKF